MTPDSVDNTVLLSCSEKRMHRQTDHFPRGTLGHGEIAHFISECGEYGLFMQTLWVINRSRDPVGLEFVPEFIAIGDPDSVLSVNMSITRTHFRHLTICTKLVCIPSTDPRSRAN